MNVRISDTPAPLPLSERRQIHIANPAAGGGKHLSAAEEAVRRTGGELLKSERPGHLGELVADALDSIPPELTAYMDNVVITLAEDPPEPGLLGLYEGVPLTERGDSYGGVLPDQIFIYWREILAICETEEDVVEEVRITVIHEIAHHFGIDDERLHELGWT